MYLCENMYNDFLSMRWKTTYEWICCTHLMAFIILTNSSRKILVKVNYLNHNEKIKNIYF